MLFSVTYFSQLQAGKLRSAVLSWDEPMTFEFQVGTANESLQWKLWRLRTTVAYRTWCCILNIALQKVLPSEFQVFHWHKNFHSCTELMLSQIPKLIVLIWRHFFGRLFELWPISCSLTSFVPMEMHSYLNITCNLFLFLHFVYYMTELWHLRLGK